MLAAAHNQSLQSVLTWAGAPDMSLGEFEEEQEVGKEDAPVLSINGSEDTVVDPVNAALIVAVVGKMFLQS